MSYRAFLACLVLASGCVGDVVTDDNAGTGDGEGEGGGGGGGGGGNGSGSGSGSGSSGPARASGGSGGALGDSMGPCADCRVHVPASYSPSQPIKLLVALHGDEGRDFGLASATGGVISMWSGPADTAGYIVFAPACGAAIGCNGAWSDHLAAQGYKLSATTLAWLDAQIDALESAYNIDRNREYLTGWSGGAYWLGYYAQARAERFAAVAFVAGGMPAYTSFNGCPSCKLPGYFLGGDMDFRTAQMNDTANAFNSCGEAIQTDLVANADHQATIGSLSGGRAAAILTWFETRPLSCGP